jgi:hypothetical protein
VGLARSPGRPREVLRDLLAFPPVRRAFGLTGAGVDSTPSAGLPLGIKVDRLDILFPHDDCRHTRHLHRTEWIAFQGENRGCEEQG